VGDEMHVKCLIKFLSLKIACNPTLLVANEKEKEKEKKKKRLNIVGHITQLVFDENSQGIDSIGLKDSYIHVEIFGEEDVLLTGFSLYNIPLSLSNKVLEIGL